MNPSLWPHQSAVWGSPRSKWCGPRHDACHGLHLAASQALAISPGRGAPTECVAKFDRPNIGCTNGNLTAALGATRQRRPFQLGRARSGARPAEGAVLVVRTCQVGSSRPTVSALRYSGRRSDTVCSSVASSRMGGGVRAKVPVQIDGDAAPTANSPSRPASPGSGQRR